MLEHECSTKMDSALEPAVVYRGCAVQICGERMVSIRLGSLKLMQMGKKSWVRANYQEQCTCIWIVFGFLFQQLSYDSHMYKDS